MKVSFQDKAALAAQIYHLVQTYFAHWQALEDWDYETAYSGFLVELEGCQTRREVFFCAQKFMAQLNNGHTAFVDFTLLSSINPLGFDARIIGGKWCVTSSALREVPAGSCITKVNGREARLELVKWARFISASKPQSKAELLFCQPLHWPQTGVLEFAHGMKLEFNLGAKGPQPNRLEACALREYQGVPVLHIRHFEGPEVEAKALEFVCKIKDAPALIIDLRGNGGGNSPLDLIEALMNKPIPSWIEETNSFSGPPFDMRPARVSMRVNTPDKKPLEDAFQGKMAILTDGRTGSAAECFVMPFKASSRAVIVGQVTLGSNGQPVFAEPFVGAKLIVGAKRQYFPDGTPFERVGIVPDVEVAPTAADIANGFDRVMHAAWQHLVKEAV
ncbi:S41 family peptidase [Flexibacterium corallicola]|uniref:S41 family peptidase n=1 Tax=Flexibacterium corallicola TaxID=3037259 RepID=UPI00286EB774|nr:S41 family peptidase [Pseudovibrio sp. M1P-2-3]